MTPPLPKEPFSASQGEELVDDPMPDYMLRRIKAFRFQIRDAKVLANRIKTKYGSIPYVWSLFVTCGTAAVASAVQIFVGDRSEPQMNPDVRDMYMLGFFGFGAAAAVLIVWWFTSRRDRRHELDDLCEKLEQMDYPVREEEDVDEEEVA